MTKSEDKLLELLLEKVEKLEAELAEVKESSGGQVIHNHYHSHYHSPHYGNYPYWWNNRPYTTWNVAANSGSISAAHSPKLGYSHSGGYSGGLVQSSDTSKLGGSVNYNKLEDQAEYQVIALAKV